MDIREGAIKLCNRCGWSPNPNQPHAADCCGEMVPLATIGADKEPYEVRTTSSTGGQKGVKLERHSLIPVLPLRLLAEHYGKGAKKYSDHQWRAGIGWDFLFDAEQRHMLTFWDGEDFDVCPLVDGVYTGMGCITEHPETGADVVGMTENGRTCYNHTGSLHLVNAAWMVFALIEEYYKHPKHDNRYIPKDANDRDHS